MRRPHALSLSPQRMRSMSGRASGAGHMQGLAELAVEEGRWEEALSLLRRHAELAPTVALPYAHWLLAQGRARDAYRTYR